MVEQMPTFPGGQQELMSYLGKNIKYPTIAQENGTQGRVIIQFGSRTRRFDHGCACGSWGRPLSG